MTARTPIILNVDDAGANRYVLSRILSRAGYQIQEASSGSEALQHLSGASPRPDLVVLDVHLPDIDGFEVCRRIKTNPQLARIPVLQLSALYVHPEERARGLESGADAYLVSPVDPLELVASVRALLRAREASDRETRLREVLETAGVGTLDCNLLTNQVEWSPNSAALLGMPTAQFDGRFATYRHRIDPVDAAHLERVVEDARERRCDYVSSYRVSAVDGATRWIEEKGRFAYNPDGEPLHLTRVIADVTERRATETALRASEERFRVALTHAPISVHTTDRELRYTWVHHPLSGRSVDELLGRRDDAILPAPSAARLMALKQQVLDSGIGKRADLDIESADGEIRNYHLTLEPVRDADGEVTGLTVAAMDQTPVKRFAEELKRANLAKDEALATVAHELRNPLTAIRNAVYLLNRPEIDAPGRARATAVIERQVQQQSRLIDDLLDVARLGRGKLELRLSAVNLAQLVRSILCDFANISESAGVSLASRLPDRSVWVHAEPARLTQVVSNLLDNAVKFTPTGGSITVQLQELELDGLVELTIQDTGIGMEPEFAPRAFETFVQQEAGRGRQRGGLGLGLALVRGLTRMHGGEVSAHSAGAGLGSTFTVTLPLLARKAVDASAAP
ncbi:MAG: ATP-binding protein [Actinomycetota bacterium]